MSKIKKHISKFPIGTLVSIAEKRFGETVGEIYGIVVAHTTPNIEVLLSKPIHGRTKVITSPRLVKSVQRPYKKPKV